MERKPHLEICKERNFKRQMVGLSVCLDRYVMVGPTPRRKKREIETLVCLYVMPMPVSYVNWLIGRENATKGDVGKHDVNWVENTHVLIRKIDD